MQNKETEKEWPWSWENIQEAPISQGAVRRLLRMREWPTVGNAAERPSEREAEEGPLALARCGAKVTLLAEEW